MMLYGAWKQVIYTRYSLYGRSVRTRTSPLLLCHKLNYQSKIVFISLEGNRKIIKNVLSPSHSAGVFVLAFSHLKIPSEPNLFFSSCSCSWKFVLFAVERCLHTAGHKKAAGAHAALSTFSPVVSVKFPLNFAKAVIGGVVAFSLDKSMECDFTSASCSKASRWAMLAQAWLVHFSNGSVSEVKRTHGLRVWGERLTVFPSKLKNTIATIDRTEINPCGVSSLAAPCWSKRPSKPLSW